MKIKLLFAVCISLLAVSCQPTNTGKTPDNVEPPIIQNKLTSVTASEAGSGSPEKIFGAVYENGHIKELMTTEWMAGGEPMGTIQFAAASKNPVLGRIFKSPIFSTKAIEADLMYFNDIKYEKDCITLTEKEGEIIILNQDNSGRVVSLTFDDGEEELEGMRFSYNSAGQLSEFIMYSYNSTEEGEYVDSNKTSLEYTDGDISSVMRTITEEGEIIQSFVISFTDVTVENKQGIFLPILDNAGWMPVLSTLDVIGVKSSRLPKSGTMKITMVDGEAMPDIEGFSITLDFEYGMSADGYLETLKSVTNIDLSITDPEEGVIEEHEKIDIDFVYSFDK